MRNSLFYIFFLICLSTLGQNMDLEVKKVPKTVIPGNQYKLFFKLSNNSPKDSLLYPRLTLPKNWSIITSKKLKRLKPGETGTFFYAINVPKSTLAGKSQIKLKLKNRQKEVLIERLFDIDVSRVTDISIKVIAKPDFVLGNDPFVCEYVIKNQGNDTEKLLPSSKTGIASEQAITLKPNESVNYKIEHKAQLRSTHTPYDFFPEINLYLHHSDSLLKEFTPIKVYPRVGKSDPFFRYPVEVGINYNSTFNDEQQGALQYKFHGYGYLDKSSKHLLEIIADSETEEGFNQFGNFRKTVINYSNKTTDVKVMDFFANLSHLTERSRWGQGINVSHKHKKYRFDAFYMTPRFFPQVKREFGGSTEYTINENWKTKGGWLTKVFSADSIGVSNLYSLSGEYNHVDLNSTLEFSASSGEGKTGFAAYTKMNYKNPRLRYQHEFVYAGEEFTGYFTNSLLFNGSLSYALNSKLGVHISGGYNSVNESQDTIISYIAPRYWTQAIGMRYKISKTQSVQLNYTFNEKEDRLEPQKFHFKEHAARLAYNLRRRKSAYQFNTSFGQGENLLITEGRNSAFSLESNLTFKYEVHKRTSITSFVKYLNSNRFSIENEEDFFYGINLFYKAKKKLAIAFQYKNEFTPDEESQQNSFFGGSLDYLFNKKHKLSIDANYVGSRGSEERELFVSANYTLKLNVPLYKSFNAGHLEGQVHGIGAEKVEGIVLGLNERIAITDEEGKFEFNNLKPGKYFLMPHSSSFGKNDITEIPGPYEVEILPKETGNFEFNIIKSSRIQGIVNFKKGKTYGSSKNEIGETRVVVELKNDKLNFYTLTNKDGEFYFGDVRPGKWKINIVDDTLKKKFSIPDNYQTLELKNGENKKVSFTMKPKTRKMRMGKKKFNLSK